MHRFLLPHAVAFFSGLLGLADDHDRLTAIAGYILANKLEVVTNRDVQRGSRTMRNLDGQEVQRVFEQLSALGWLRKRRGSGRPRRAGTSIPCVTSFSPKGQS